MFSRRLSFRVRMMMLVSVFLAGLAVTHIMYSVMILSIRINSPMYEQIITGKDVVAAVLPPPQYVIESYLTVFQIMGAEDQSDRDRFIAKFRQLESDYHADHLKWEKELEEGDLRDKLTVDSFKAATLFFSEVNESLIEPLEEGTPPEELRGVLHGPLVRYYDEHRRAVDDVVTLAGVRIDGDELQASRTARNWLIAQIVVGGIILALLLWISWVIVRVMKQTQDLIEQVQRSSVQMNATATQIAAAAGEQNSTMQGFNASTSEIAASVKEISATG